MQFHWTNLKSRRTKSLRNWSNDLMRIIINSSWIWIPYFKKWNLYFSEVYSQSVGKEYIYHDNRIKIYKFPFDQSGTGVRVESVNRYVSSFKWFFFADLEVIDIAVCFRYLKNISTRVWCDWLQMSFILYYDRSIVTSISRDYFFWSQRFPKSVMILMKMQK